MSLPPSKLMVLAGEKFACIKIIGKGNFTNSVEFATLVRELSQKGCNYFVLDLSECVLLDSTFLGVLAGFGVRMSEKQKDPCEQGIELLNPSPSLTDSLETLGVIHLFKVTQGSWTPPEGVEKVEHAPAKASKEEVTRACLEAHRTLMEINPANVARFKDVAQFLAEDLKRIKARE